MGAAMANETLGSLKNLPTNMKHTLVGVGMEVAYIVTGKVPLLSF
jgi:hypothetical protein